MRLVCARAISYSPWPEEANRTLTGHLAMYHFSPTETSRQNLLRENVADSPIITGNTVIDALLSVRDQVMSSDTLRQNWRQITRLYRPIKR
ncbi:UDP-N-acetylglucosamine 2-epimerase [Escherichia coli]